MKYILFGAGEYGKGAVILLGRENIRFIFDNDPKKWNTRLNGIPVLKFDDTKNLINEKIVITVAPDKAESIVRQLEDNGIYNYVLYEEIATQIIKKKILSRPDYISIYKKAVGWIKKYSLEGEGIICNTGLPKSYPEVTGYYIPTLLKWGYRELACSYAKWLCSVQKEDGSWYDAENKAPYIFDSAQILKGLLAIRSIMPQVDKNIQAGCEWIFEQMREDGRLITPVTDAWGTDRDTCDEIIHIYCISPLIEAAKVFGKPEYREKALKVWEYYKQNYYEKIMNFSLLSHFYAYLMEALLDIGETDMAKEAMSRMEKYQKPSGAVPAYHNCDWICSTGLFQLSLVWFRLGDIDRGRRAFEYACKLQNETGGWFGSYQSEENPKESNTYIPSSEISWAVKYFLDALYYKNLAEFEASCNEFLPHIDKADGRYQIILGEMCTLKQEKGNRILDVGCGKGRYLKNLAEDMPENQYAAVDLSEGVMEFFDSDIAEKKQGALTDIPYKDHFFDLVYACESLEHAIDIENALQEMARVTRPGGKLIIIDKNLKALGRLEINPWEQWFDEDDLKKMLNLYCTDVTVYSDISYDGKDPDGLFCAWVGKVR